MKSLQVFSSFIARRMTIEIVYIRRDKIYSTLARSMPESEIAIEKRIKEGEEK